MLVFETVVLGSEIRMTTVVVLVVSAGRVIGVAWFHFVGPRRWLAYPQGPSLILGHLYWMIDCYVNFTSVAGWSIATTQSTQPR